MLSSNQRPPRIALVTPMLPVPHDPTRGRYIHETARALARRCPVQVFFQQVRYPDLPFLTARSYLYGRMPKDYRAPGIEVTTLEYPAIPVLTRPFNSYLSARKLLPSIAKFAPDVIVGYWIYPDGHAALLCAKKLKVPCVIGALGSDIHVRDRLNAWFTRRTLEQADALIAVSEATRRTAIEQFSAPQDRVYTVVNGFNTGIFHRRDRAAMRHKLGVQSDSKLILYVGRFVEAKGLRELLGAFEQLAARDGSLRLALVGDGVMRQELGAMIEAAGLGAKVLLPGGMEPEGVAEWIAASDLLCLPSWSEGYPNVLVEAIACGRPVVATDVGGTREIVSAEAGLLIPPRNVDALREALAESLSRSWDESRLAGLITRTWDDVAEETLAICERVVLQRQ